MIDKGQLQVDGTFQVQVNVRIQDDSYIPVPDLVHEKSEISLEINKPARHIHIFSTVNLDVVDQIAKKAVLQPTPLVQVRIGLSQKSGSFWFPWQRHVLLYTDIVPSGKGYQVSFITGDLLETMSRQFKTRYHSGTISDIVQRIATENGLQSMVEPTIGKWSYVQSNETDGDFIGRISPRAVNGSGYGGFRHYVQDNVFHFHTLDYASTLRVANVFSLAGTKVVLSSRIQDSIDEGGPGVRIVGVDPYEGKIFAFTSDPNKQTLHGNQTPDLSPLGPLTLENHPSWNREDEVKAEAQSRYDAARVNMMHCTMTVEKGYPLQLNDLIQNVLNSASAQQSPWSGLYSVMAVTHLIEKGTTSTVAKLQRGEFFSNARPNRIGDVVPQEFVAKGTPINLPGVDSSFETKGPPDSFTGGQYIKSVRAV